MEYDEKYYFDFFKECNRDDSFHGNLATLDFLAVFQNSSLFSCNKIRKFNFLIFCYFDDEFSVNSTLNKNRTVIAMNFSNMSQFVLEPKKTPVMNLTIRTGNNGFFFV